MNLPEFEYLGPYKVERILGRGAMGSVYKGIHAKSGEAVAIKVIATGIANNMRFRRRFAAEVETLKRLQHPHIVQLVGYGEEQGLLFYSMEYVDGHSLHDHLRQHERLAWDEVIQIGIETTAALKHAHDIGIIHRDLKPANLMLNKAGRIKLTDFGIAKLFGSSDMTAVGSVIGTADYMPPEQAEGKPVTVRSDLYSLGGVLYALLSGKAAFGGKSVPEVLHSVRYNSVPDLRDRVPDVPRELAELIHQMLEKDPQQRPPTALVVGNRLKSLQQGLKRMTGSGDTHSVGVEKGATKPPGTQLTSLDLSDVDDHELRLTSPSPSSDPKSQGPQGKSAQPASDHSGHNQPEPTSRVDAPPLGTHELQTLVAPDGMVPPPSDEKFTAIAGDGRSPVGNSADASADFISSRSTVAPITSGGPSHFTPITKESVKPTIFGAEEVDDSHRFDWIHYGSVAGLVALLIGCVGLTWWLLRPESANNLYANVSAAVASGDDAQLLQVSGQIDEFLARFPDDERSAELQALSDEVELARWTRILQRRASRNGGTDSLSAIEQGFLQSVTLLSENSELAQKKLSAFVQVFGANKALPREERRLVDLAEYALRAGTTRLRTETPESAQQLQRLIEEAQATLPPEQLKAYFANLLTLYGELEWAKEQVASIRKLLEAGS